MLRLVALHFVSAIATLVAFAAAAEQADPVLLTVRQEGGRTWTFDRQALEALDWQTITTVTSFTDGPQAFSGVPLAAIVAATGVVGGTVDAVALNDYQVEMPAAHIDAYGVFLALDQNGVPMRVRDRGPIWIVYPSATLEAATDRFDSFMVWQLRELTFRP